MLLGPESSCDLCCVGAVHEPAISKEWFMLAAKSVQPAVTSHRVHLIDQMMHAGLQPPASEICEDAGFKAAAVSFAHIQHDRNCHPKPEPDSRAGEAEQARGVCAADNLKRA